MSCSSSTTRIVGACITPKYTRKGLVPAFRKALERWRESGGPHGTQKARGRTLT
jgi:hypothetical protein